MIGTVLSNRYELAREIGRGGMGVVYLARDLVLERDVAVKLLPAGQLSRETEERFRREARVVAKMDHPSIVPLHDVAEHEGAIFLVMPFVQGRSLRAVLRDDELAISTVLDIGIQVAGALDYSHSLGVVHRDIKPENILIEGDLGEGLRVRLTDFGIATAEFEEHDTQAGVILGTGAYLSPEQISEGVVDARTDVYGLGAVLYECLAGRPPFAGAGSSLYYRIAFVPPRPIRAWKPEVGLELEEIILRCIEKDQTRRPHSARQVADALRAYRAAIGGLSAGARLPERPNAPRTTPVTAFVDRETELAELVKRLTWSASGEAQLALVAGDAGVGKSRLLEELDAIAVARRIRVAHGRFLDHDRSFPYQGFCDVIQEFFLNEVTSPTGPPADFADLSPDLAALFPALTEIVTLRSAAVDSRTSASGSAAFSERTEIYELLARTIARIGGGAPLVLLLEDLHASEASVEALQYIVRRLVATPTLFVATYRTSEVDSDHPIASLLEGFRGDRRFTWMRLGPLSREQQVDLVASIVGSRHIDPEFLDRLYEATEGVPFFATELVRSLVASGSLAPHDGQQWALRSADGIRPDAIPETIRRTIEMRARRLDRAARDVLNTASVIGRAFVYSDLELLCGDRHDLEEAVDRLVDLGFLEETRGSRGERLEFSSAIVRDALYGAIPRRRRRALHAAYAQQLERSRATKADRVLPQLVHHYAQAGAGEKVVTFGLQLARRALDAYSPEDATRAARTVLDFLGESERDDPENEGQARCLLAAALRLAGDPEAALAEYGRAVALLERSGQPAVATDAMARAAETAWEARLVERAERWVERTIDAARTLGGTPALDRARTSTLTRALRLAATIASLRGDLALAKHRLAELDAVRGVAPESAGEPDPHARLVVGLPAAVRAAHPVDIRSRADEEMFANVVETLVTSDAHGTLVPALAARWELDADATTCRIVLESGIVAHDGRAIGAREVKRAFEAAILRSRGDLPPAFGVLRGVREFREGLTSEVSGIVAHSETLLEMRLDEPIPIFPAMLTDVKTSVALESVRRASPWVVGTGPFAIASLERGRAVLERVPSPRRGRAAAVGSIEFRGELVSAEIAAGLRSGEIDVGRGLAVDELEEMLRDRRRRFRFLEAPAANVWFLLFNRATELGSNGAFREALGRLARDRNVMQEALGRLALPAEGLLPPGMLGHDPDRRERAVTGADVERMLAGCGVERPVRVRAAVVSAFRDRFSPLLDAVVRLWALHGVEVSIEVPRGLEHFDNEDLIDRVDVLFGGWSADFNDPDNFTHALFHSADGVYRRYHASPELDAQLEAGRREPDPETRCEIYSRVESSLVDSATVVPLLHEGDLRVVTRRVARAELSAAPPFFNYAELEVRSAPPAAGRANGVPVVPLPVGLSLATLDPATIQMDIEAEVVSAVYETLTRSVEGANAAPWLARAIETDRHGERYHFRLREGVLFHDGRTLSARDVRYSLERLLREERSSFRWQLSPIRGAAEVLRGERTELAGFKIVSRTEFTLDLERPVAFLPVLLSHPATAIVPEGSAEFTSPAGVPGTGPFRVALFEPRSRLELEANNAYWRAGYPRSEGLVFDANVDPRGVLEGFRSGRYAVAFNLFPEDEEALRRDPAFAAGYRETPCLQTVLLAFNTRRGPFADPDLRRRVAGAIDVDALVRRSCGRLAAPARCLIPPGLLGHDSLRRTTGGITRPLEEPESVEARCLMRPLFAVGSLSRFRADLVASLAGAGVHVEVVAPDGPRWNELRDAGAADLFLLGWNADYPDPDAVARGLLHSETGWIGRFCGSPALDRLLERACLAVEPEARHDLYREIEAAVGRDALVLPIFHPRMYRFGHPELQGLEVSFVSPFVAYEELRLER